MPTPGLETQLLVAASAFIISLISATAGVTGAFLLVPFQVSILGLGSPSVSATNHLYNVVAAPGGVLGYREQRRMVWSLAAVLVLGTVPGILGGILLRVRYLQDPASFRPFAGGVLFVLGLLLLVRTGGSRTGSAQCSVGEADVTSVETGWLRIRYRFDGEPYSVAVPPLFLFCLLIGTIGGAYGVGGGVFTSAYLIGVCRLPVHSTAGATLLATFVASCAGVLGFATLSWEGVGIVSSSSPIWSLGLLMGFGGLAGGYLGSRLQRRLASPLIAVVLAVFLLLLGGAYLIRPL
jgi:uncharacterized membrane protein YfcA